MELTGEQRIAAPRQMVWQALNDPAVLAVCIPGCQSLEKEAEDRFSAVAEVKIGPIGARFKGAVTLSEIDAPNGYVISGSGNGGIAGSARGKARVTLADDSDGTRLTYQVSAEVGGRMAQLGGPIIDATARNLAGKFFAKFGEVVGQSPAAPAPTLAAPPSATQQQPAAPRATPSAVAAGGTIWGWTSAVVAGVLAGYVLGRAQASGAIIASVVVLLTVVAAAAFEAGRRGGRP